MKTTMTSALRLISAIVIAGCADEPDRSTQGSSSGEPRLTEDGEPFIPTSIIDPVTGDQEALNFPSDEIFAYAEDSNKSLAPLGSVDAPITVGGVEVEVKATTSNYAIIAVGARVANSAVTTAWIQAVNVRRDGLLGTTSSWKAGADVPTPEVWCAADPGYLIVGVGGKITNGNMVAMTLITYLYDARTRTLTGDPLPKRCGTQADSEREVVLNDEKLVGGYKFWQVAATGVGFRELNDNLDRVRLYYGNLY